MLDMISPRNFHLQARTIESMHRLRYRVFIERLGWDIETDNGLEQDQFDGPGAVYLVYCAYDGEVVGCTRLLNTAGPNLLRDVFPYLVYGGNAPSSPRIWESTRFAIDHERCHAMARGSVNRVTSALLAGILEFALANGITQIVSVSDVRMERILRRAGWPPHRLGVPAYIGSQSFVGERFEVTRSNLEEVRRRGKLKEPVLAGREVVLEERVA